MCSTTTTGCTNRGTGLSAATRGPRSSAWWAAARWLATGDWGMLAIAGALLPLVAWQRVAGAGVDQLREHLADLRARSS